MSSAKVENLPFVKTIFDNVHGFIHLTQIECDIINHNLFQRLRNIKQLGLLDYVFPGAVHNRFNHSLGVMHIADKMVASLQGKEHLLEPDPLETRQTIRLAALLHDIGHYPLSHIIEMPVKSHAKEQFIKVPPPEVGLRIKVKGEETQRDVPNQVDRLIERSDSHRWNHTTHQLINDKLDYAHHERMASIVINKSDIRTILLDNGIDQDRIRDICQIIAGSHGGPESAIIHSELDADRFDYLLRDSKQTGVIYGLFDLDQVIRHLDCLEPTDLKPDEGTSGLCVDYRGQKAVEDYLLARYFLYSTVIYQKTSIGFHKMASMVYAGLLERGLVHSYFDLVNFFDTNDIDSYMNYDDSYFWNALKGITLHPEKIEDSAEYMYSPDFIVECSKKLLTRRPLKLVEEKQKIIRTKIKNKKDNASSEDDASEEDNVTGLEHYQDRIIARTICERADIHSNWLIVSELKQSIIDLSPFIPLDQSETSTKLQTAIIMIKKGDGTISYLKDESASIIKVLANQQLKIVGVYTRDRDYKDRIDEAVRQYTANP